MERVLSDRELAFGRLVTEFQSPVRRYLLYLTERDAFLADDLAQDTFVKAYIHWDSFKGNGLKTWLFTIAYRTFLDHKRSQKISLELEYAKGLYSGPNHMEILSETLSCLDDTEKHVAILAYVEQLSHSEIEKVTKMKLGTIKTILRRVKGKLQDFLKNEK